MTPVPTFVLKNPNSDKPMPINMIVRFNSERIVYSTGERIHKKNWDTEKGRAKESRGFLEGYQINEELERCKLVCKEVFRNFTFQQKEITKEEIKAELDRLLRGHLPKVENTILLSDFISQIAEETNHSKETKKSYNNTLEHIKAFEKSKRYRYKIKDVDISYYEGLLKFLISKNLATNTISKIIKNLKVFLGKAMDLGIISENRSLLKKMVRPQEENTTKIYLTKVEIDAIYALDLSGNKKLERVRDLFVLACNVGLRFSDFVSIKKENIKSVINSFGNHRVLLTIRTKKTNQNVSVPLNKQALSILEKYEWNIPKPISNQKMNDYLKEIGYKAKLLELVQTTITLGGERVINTQPKYQLVSTHSARRSFASNLFLDGVPSLQIMKLTGHKTERSFLKYIRVSAEEHALKMADLEFFG